MRPILFLGLVLVTMARLHGDPVQFASGPTRTSLIELYTSEGCSSCPPAEKWLASLRDTPGLWHDYVPVAFHVDYWNRQGWPDRFSTHEFTQRQYDYASKWGGNDKVYTPCVVVDGVIQGSALAAAPAPPGKLTTSYDGTTLHAEFSPTTPRKGDKFEIHAAILGGGITSHVTAGENRGETLHHEFIALALAQAPLGRDLPLVVPKISGVPRHALAVWVTRRGELVPLQATGGWLD